MALQWLQDDPIEEDEEDEDDEEVELGLTPAAAKKMTVPELKKMLVSRGENPFGNKDALVERLTTPGSKRKATGGSSSPAKRAKADDADTVICSGTDNALPTDL